MLIYRWWWIDFHKNEYIRGTTDPQLVKYQIYPWRITEGALSCWLCSWLRGRNYAESQRND